MALVPWRRPPRLRLLAAALLVAAACGGRPPSSDLCAAGETDCRVPLQVRWTGGPGVTFAPALLEVAPGGLRLSLSGKVTPPARTELEELKLEARLTDRAGALVGTLPVDAQPSFATPLRPGDTAPFATSAAVPAATRQVEVVKLGARTTAAPELYGVATPVELAFEPAAAAHPALEAAYRRRLVKAFPDRTAVEGVLEITNRGPAALRTLELEVRAVGAGAQVVGEPARVTVVPSHMLPMEPGERRTTRFQLHVPGTLHGERVVVTRVE